MLCAPCATVVRGDRVDVESWRNHREPESLVAPHCAGKSSEAAVRGRWDGPDDDVHAGSAISASCNLPPSLATTVTIYNAQGWQSLKSSCGRRFRPRRETHRNRSHGPAPGHPGS